MDEDSCTDVYGLPMPKRFREECIRSAMSYKARVGETIIVTYPKCGTHWTQVIAWNIITRAKPRFDVGEFGLMCPYIEMNGPGPAESPGRMGPIMTHLPMSRFRPVDHAKYIYVARNPYDVAASYYHFNKGFTPKTVSDVSFGKFLSLFLNGKVKYGDYMDHLLPWYELRNNTNVLFITYEQLKSDIQTTVLRITDFLGKNHGDSLREDQGLMQRVVDASTLEGMKALFNLKREERREKIAALALEKGIPFERLTQMPSVKSKVHEWSGICSEKGRR